MTYQQFEDTLIWKEAKETTVIIYKLFSQNKDFSFRDQIQRATISIMNNIAEGFERRSDKEFKQFLYIAKGSAGEVRSMLIIGKELGYISNTEYLQTIEKVTTISRMLAGFIKKLS